MFPFNHLCNGNIHCSNCIFKFQQTKQWKEIPEQSLAKAEQ
jgi:hypothetical protein